MMPENLPNITDCACERKICKNDKKCNKDTWKQIKKKIKN